MNSFYVGRGLLGLSIWPWYKHILNSSTVGSLQKLNTIRRKGLGSFRVALEAPTNEEIPNGGGMRWGGACIRTPALQIGSRRDSCCAGNFYCSYIKAFMCPFQLLQQCHNCRCIQWSWLEQPSLEFSQLAPLSPQNSSRSPSAHISR